MLWSSARATSCMAILPAAPGLFSTKTFCPKVLESSAAVERATISELPPGAKGTTKRTGRVGQASSAARAMPGSRLEQAIAPAPVSKWRREMASTSWVDGLSWAAMGLRYFCLLSCIAQPCRTWLQARLSNSCQSGLFAAGRASGFPQYRRSYKCSRQLRKPCSGLCHDGAPTIGMSPLSLESIPWITPLRP